MLLFDKGRIDFFRKGGKPRKTADLFFPKEKPLIKREVFVSKCEELANDKLNMGGAQYEKQVLAFFHFISGILSIEGGNLRYLINTKQQPIENPGQQPENARDEGAREEEEEAEVQGEDLKCIICLTEPRNVLLGCGHCTMCQGCHATEFALRKTCSTCRKKIKLTVNIIDLPPSCFRCKFPKPNVAFASCGHVPLCSACDKQTTAVCRKLICPVCNEKSGAKLEVYFS